MLLAHEAKQNDWDSVISKPIVEPEVSLSSHGSATLLAIGTAAGNKCCICKR